MCEQVQNANETPRRTASPPPSSLSGRKVRFDGNDDALTELAKRNAMEIGAGHSFIIFMDGARRVLLGCP